VGIQLVICDEFEEEQDASGAEIVGEEWEDEF